MSAADIDGSVSTVLSLKQLSEASRISGGASLAAGA